jgi:hypothetical protein
MALKSFIFRYKNCRPGYKIFINDKQEYFLELVDGTVLIQSDIAPNIILEIKTSKNNSNHI